MAPFVEFEARDVVRALASACKKLNLSQDQLNYEICSHGAAGIFGLLGIRKARIRVQLPQDADTSENIVAAEDGGPATARATDVSGSEIHQVAVTGRVFLQRLTDAILPGTQIDVVTGKTNLKFLLNSPNNAALVGKKGETLAALQYLVERKLYRSSRNRLRVSVDAGDYLKQQRQKLLRRAQELADQVHASQKSLSIGNLNPRERRIIHLALKDHPRVDSKSLGKGYLRKLLIFPARSSDVQG